MYDSSICRANFQVHVDDTGFRPTASTTVHAQPCLRLTLEVQGVGQPPPQGGPSAERAEG